MDKDECSSADLADVFARLEKADPETLARVRVEIDQLHARKQHQENTHGQPIMTPDTRAKAHTDHGSAGSALGSVSLGAKFVYRTAVILGPECADARKPPFEDQVLTVVGFEPRYKNNVVVQEPNGRRSLLPISMVRKGLSLSPIQENIALQREATFDNALAFVRRANGSALNALLHEIKMARKGHAVNASIELGA